MSRKKPPIPTGRDAIFLGRPGAPRGAVITPSILSADFARLGEELARCRRARARWIHVDVMDGHFVPNLTLGPPILKACRRAEPDLFYDTHLMIEEPMRYAEAFRDAGADLLTIHAEVSQNLIRDLRALRRMGLRSGVSIKPKTPVKAILDALPFADLVLVMTVEPGFGGQALIGRTLNKVRELDLLRHRENLPFRLEVDGGINAETIALAASTGADVMVAGSAVFNGAASVAENLRMLRGLLPPPAAKA